MAHQLLDATGTRFTDEEIVELAEFFTALEESMPAPEDHPVRKLAEAIDMYANDITG